MLCFHGNSHLKRDRRDDSCSFRLHVLPSFSCLLDCHAQLIWRLFLSLHEDEQDEKEEKEEEEARTTRNHNDDEDDDGNNQCCYPCHYCEHDPYGGSRYHEGD